MKEEVIITGYSNPTSEGIVLHTNISASLKTGNVKNTTVWVSWDKIGKALFDNYTERVEVSDLNELKNKIR